MNRHKNFIFKILILIFFLLSLIISFYFAINAILKYDFNSLMNKFASTVISQRGILNIPSVDWWIGVLSVLFGSIFLFVIFLIIYIRLRVKDKNEIKNYITNSQNVVSHDDYWMDYNQQNSAENRASYEYSYHNYVPHERRKFIPYSKRLHDPN